jgi:hypothetical protein
VAVPGKETRLTMIPSQSNCPNGGIVEAKLRYFRCNNAVPAEVAMAKARYDQGEDAFVAYQRLKDEAYQKFLAKLRELGAVHPIFNDIEDGIYEDAEDRKTYLYGWFYVPETPKEA